MFRTPKRQRLPATARPVGSGVSVVSVLLTVNEVLSRPVAHDGQYETTSRNTPTNYGAARTSAPESGLRRGRGSLTSDTYIHVY